MNHARTHIKNEKNDNNERCICAHAREKQKGTSFDFAFGTAAAVLFLLSAATEHAAFAALFLCPLLPAAAAGERWDYFSKRES